MSDALTIALAVTGGGIAGPVIMAVTVGRIARRERKEKWAHDEALLQAQHANTRMIEVGNDKLTEVAEVANQTHALVNSDMTDEKKSQLATALALRVVLSKLIAQDGAAGRAPSPDDVEALHITQGRIGELTKVIDAREAAQKAIDDKAAADLAAVESANGAS